MSEPTDIFFNKFHPTPREPALFNVKCSIHDEGDGTWTLLGEVTDNVGVMRGFCSTRDCDDEADANTACLFELAELLAQALADERRTSDELRAALAKAKGEHE